LVHSRRNNFGRLHKHFGQIDHARQDHGDFP
jgi:hypothetical protein